MLSTGECGWCAQENPEREERERERERERKGSNWMHTQWRTGGPLPTGQPPTDLSSTTRTLAQTLHLMGGSGKVLGSGKEQRLMRTPTDGGLVFCFFRPRWCRQGFFPTCFFGRVFSDFASVGKKTQNVDLVLFDLDRWHRSKQHFFLPRMGSFSPSVWHSSGALFSAIWLTRVRGFCSCALAFAGVVVLFVNQGQGQISHTTFGMSSAGPLLRSTTPQPDHSSAGPLLSQTTPPPHSGKSCFCAFFFWCGFLFLGLLLECSLGETVVPEGHRPPKMPNNCFSGVILRSPSGLSGGGRGFAGKTKNRILGRSRGPPSPWTTLAWAGCALGLVCSGWW